LDSFLDEQKNKSAFFRIVCDELDVVLRVRVLTISQESKIYEGLRRGITSSTEPICVQEYKKSIVELTTTSALDLSERDYESVYDSVVSIYPSLNLESSVLILTIRLFKSRE